MRGIGAMAALRFCRGPLARVLHAMGRDGRQRMALAATPDRAQARWPRGVATVPQGHGALGQPKHRATRSDRRGGGGVGPDVPGLCAADAAAAFAALGLTQSGFTTSEDRSTAQAGDCAAFSGSSCKTARLGTATEQYAFRWNYRSVFFSVKQ
jgi:hypothetical protein